MIQKKKHHVPTAKSLENLIPQSMRTKDEQRRIASMGGKAAQAKMLEEKAFEKAVKVALAQTNPTTGNTFLEDCVASVVNRLLESGDPKSLIALRDTSGESPKNEEAEGLTKIAQALRAANGRV